MAMKFFGRWDVAGIQVQDPGLQSYINLRMMHVPRMAGRNTRVRFWKNKYTIIERFMNKLMAPGHKGKKHFISSGRCGGKGLTSVALTLKMFNLIEQKTKKNPIEVFVKAVENAAPREDITTIEYGGAKYPHSVDCSPQRRIDIALRFMVQGSYQKSYGSKIKAHEALADEIIRASQSDGRRFAISKKLELERQADAAR